MTINKKCLQVVPVILSQSASVKYTLSVAYNPMLTIYSMDGIKDKGKSSRDFSRPVITA